MELYADNGEIIEVFVWEYGKGEFRPLQTYEAIEEFDINIDEEKIKVYFNKSKSSVDYYYLKFNDLWHWTRDEKIRNYNEYST